MGRRSGTGGYQTRSIGGPLVHAFPVDRHNAFRPSGDPVKDEPEIERETWFEILGRGTVKTRAEQAEEDAKAGSLMRDPQHYRYWDNIRFARQEKQEAEELQRRTARKNRNKKSRKIKRAMELLK